MYIVRLVNFAWDPQDNRFESYADAIRKARDIGFECRIDHEGVNGANTIVASYSPLYGMRTYDRVLAGLEPALLPISIQVSGVGTVTDPELIKKYMGK